MDELKYLEEQQVNPNLLGEVEAFRKEYPVPEEVRNRIAKPPVPYYGREIREMAIAALLEGENVLLSGPKATGKNILAENLAWIFGRPSYNMSFNVNTDSSSLIGTDTFIDNEVRLRRGPVYQCAENGGFGIFDEINMAKNDAVSVLHATLDYRRLIDVPGYDRIELHPATRFMGTMNYGYAGTRELNEALTSRFAVIEMPPATRDAVCRLLKREFPGLKTKWAQQLADLFKELENKCEGAEISTKSLDMRGMVSAVRLMEKGIGPDAALRMGIANKSFDPFERQLVMDTIRARIPKNMGAGELFEA